MEKKFMEIKDILGKEESLVLITSHPFSIEEEKKLSIEYVDIKKSSPGDSWVLEGDCKDKWSHVSETKATVLVKREDFVVLLIEIKGLWDNKPFSKAGSIKYFF